MEAVGWKGMCFAGAAGTWGGELERDLASWGSARSTFGRMPCIRSRIARVVGWHGRCCKRSQCVAVSAQQGPTMQASAHSGIIAPIGRQPRVDLIYLLPLGDWKAFEAALLSMASQFIGRVRLIRAGLAN